MTEYETNAALVESLEAEVSRLWAVNAELRARGESTSLRQRADAWMAVCALLRELRPSWQEGLGTTQEQALEAIRAMATQTTAAEAEQEPVAWAISYDGKTPYTFWHKGQDAVLDLEVQRLGGSACKMALYAAPQPTSQPLTADEIEQCCYAADSESKNHPQTRKWIEDFARAIERAIERAHGIGGDA